MHYHVVFAIGLYFFFFFKQKTAYEMRISDWSSDVCSSDLAAPDVGLRLASKVAASNRTNIEYLPIRACKKANIGAWPAGVCLQGNNWITRHAQIVRARLHPGRRCAHSPALPCPGLRDRAVSR